MIIVNMELVNFLKDNNIRISECGGICVNDVVDRVILCRNGNCLCDIDEYYLSPKAFLVFLTTYKTVSTPKMSKLINLLNHCDDNQLITHHIYLISTKLKAKNNEFKVGKFKGNKKQLTS